MKRFLVFAMVLVLGLMIATGCNRAQDAPSDTPDDRPAQEEPADAPEEEAAEPRGEMPMAYLTMDVMFSTTGDIEDAQAISDGEQVYPVGTEMIVVSFTQNENAPEGSSVEVGIFEADSEKPFLPVKSFKTDDLRGEDVKIMFTPEKPAGMETAGEEEDVEFPEGSYTVKVMELGSRSPIMMNFYISKESKVEVTEEEPMDNGEEPAEMDGDGEEPDEADGNEADGEGESADGEENDEPVETEADNE